MKKNSLVAAFLKDADDDMVTAVGKLQRWYNHGMDDSLLEDSDKTAIKAIELAYNLLTDVGNLANRVSIYYKVKEAVGLSSMKEVQTLVQLADAIFLSERAPEKRFKKAAIEQMLLINIEKAEKAGDFKSLTKLTEQYVALAGLDKDLTDTDNPVIETVIKLAANPELLERYNANDSAENRVKIKRLELKAKQNLTGQE